MASFGLRFAPALANPMRPIRIASARCSAVRSERSAIEEVQVRMVSISTWSVMCAFSRTGLTREALQVTAVPSRGVDRWCMSEIHPQICAHYTACCLAVEYEAKYRVRFRVIAHRDGSGARAAGKCKPFKVRRMAWRAPMVRRLAVSMTDLMSA